MSANAWNMRQIGHTDLDGHGDCMHVNVVDGYAYVAHMGEDRVGTSVVDVSDPENPFVVNQLLTPPGTHSHKLQVVDDLLLINHEQNPYEPGATSWAAGLKVCDISERSNPVEVGFLKVGGGRGVHRMTYIEPPYVYMSGSDEGYSEQFLMIVDLSDPTAPIEVGRWWPAGMHLAGGEMPSWPSDQRWAAHHALLKGDRAYTTWWDGGAFILDVSDPTSPREVAHIMFPEGKSGCTHTALPLPERDLLVVVAEPLGPGREELEKNVRLVDVSDETSPRVVGMLPRPEDDHFERGGTFGPHNLHEMRPGSFSSSTILHLTYFNAGIRAYDVSDPAAAREIAYFEPPPHPGQPLVHLNDVTVTADGLIYVTDRDGGGLYILEADLN
jgi:hypothetical protein